MYKFDSFVESRKKREIINKLSKSSVEFEYYETDGSTINAACGQLESKEIKNEI